MCCGRAVPVDGFIYKRRPDCHVGVSVTPHARARLEWLVYVVLERPVYPLRTGSDYPCTVESDWRRGAIVMISRDVGGFTR